MYADLPCGMDDAANRKIDRFTAAAVSETSRSIWSYWGRSTWISYISMTILKLRLNLLSNRLTERWNAGGCGPSELEIGTRNASVRLTRTWLVSQIPALLGWSQPSWRWPPRQGLLGPDYILFDWLRHWGFRACN